jgi:hypothetical protein
VLLLLLLSSLPQVLDALASNLKREHVLRIMLNCFVWGRSLNSIQFAKSAVYRLA